MKQAQALKLAQKKWGKNAFVRDNGLTFSDGELRPVDEDDRAKLRAKSVALKEAEPRLKPLAEWDDATPLGEYKAAKEATEKAWKKWRRQRDLAQYKCWSDRFEVGHVNDKYGFATVAGSGDTWAIALAKAGCVPKPPVTDSEEPAHG